MSDRDLPKEAGTGKKNPRSVENVNAPGPIPGREMDDRDERADARERERDAD